MATEDLSGPTATTRSPWDADAEIVVRRVGLTVHDVETGGVSCDALYLTDVAVEDGNVSVRLAPGDIPVVRAWLDRQEGGLCV